MRGLMQAYPNDVDAAVLCAESLMDLRPWDLWTIDGQAQPGTDEIVAILEKALKSNPDHIGAIHLYTHAVEASPNPGRASVYSDKLAKLAPAAGHLVHMPTHIHLRTGRYEDAVEYNALAIQADRQYIGEEKAVNTYTLMYYPHNIHMRWSALCMQGRRRDALEATRQLEVAIPDSVVQAMPMAEFFRVSKSLTQVRFGLWDEILREPAPPAGMVLRGAAWHYARGMAFAAKGKTKDAEAERDSVSAIAGGLSDEVYFSLNQAGPVFKFAAMLLSGEIMARDGRTEEAVVYLTRAAGMQDSLRYDEPKPWNATARQSLGAVLLTAGRAKEAEEVYRKDLAQYPENGWSLYGLTQALRVQKMKKEASAAEKKFKAAWIHSDVTLSASRY
jgi:tetratricopeptide (TPR) repeat protein